MTDDYFLNYCIYFDVGIVKTTNMTNDTQPNTSWYIPLNIPIKKATQKTEPNFLEIEFLSDTCATVCILNTQTWRMIKTYLSSSKHEIKQDVDTKTKTANSQLQPTESCVKLTLPPIKDQHATLTNTFAIADTKNIFLGVLFLQTYCKTIDTELYCLILKYNK